MIVYNNTLTAVNQHAYKITLTHLASLVLNKRSLLATADLMRSVTEMT